MLKTLMGEYPVTKQFHTHTDKFAFADAKKNPASAFKRTGRGLYLDVSEMAISAHLIARAPGKPYRLLPFVVLARFQHPFLVFNSNKNPSLAPQDLHGKRVGVRSYSVTTGAWIRHILAEEHGIDIARIRWITFEEPHVAEFRDPPNVHRAPAGNEIKAMLQAGELDAAIMGAIPQEENIRPLIRDPEAAGMRWTEKHGAIQLNHLVVVKSSVARDGEEGVSPLLVERKRAPGPPPMLPHGLEANRRN